MLLFGLGRCLARRLGRFGLGVLGGMSLLGRGMFLPAWRWPLPVLAVPAFVGTFAAMGASAVPPVLA